jgi:hypothetical protein
VGSSNRLAPDPTSAQTQATGEFLAEHPFHPGPIRTRGAPDGYPYWEESTHTTFFGRKGGGHCEIFGGRRRQPHWIGIMGPKQHFRPLIWGMSFAVGGKSKNAGAVAVCGRLRAGKEAIF